jgi:L-ribulose-5-phosphate 4-epimerase
MFYQELKRRAFEANLQLAELGLAPLTWGNASEIDRELGVLAIKPSGVAYGDLRPQDMVVVDLEGRTVEGALRPSSDTPAHLEFYRGFSGVGGVVHTHSKYATAFAQAGRPIPCLGTTHADAFAGEVPVTRAMSPKEILTDYEMNSGRVMVEHFRKAGLLPDQVPGILLRSHAPFCFGPSAAAAVENADVLERVAEMAWVTLSLTPGIAALSGPLAERHFRRKHGAGAYYGQATRSGSDAPATPSGIRLKPA